MLDNVKAIRGGIPLVFPHFGPWTLGPNHGFARICKWTCEKHGSGDSGSFATFTLQDNETTRAMWNHSFLLTYTVTVNAGKLVTSLAVENKGAEPFSFEALLHTYLRVPDAARTTVSGLQGLGYVDKLRAAARFVEAREHVPFSEHIDR